MDDLTDPRDFAQQGPRIHDEGADPHGVGNVDVDVRKAVLLDQAHVTLVGVGSEGRIDPDAKVGLELRGRINKSQTRANVLFLFDWDGAAALITELYALAQRAGPEYAGKLMELMDARMKKMP